MAPRLTLDIIAEIAKRLPIWECLRMGRMNRELNQIVFTWAVRYVFEHPSRFRILQPLEYALTTGNIRLLRAFRDLILTNTLRSQEGYDFLVTWTSCMREIIDFEAFVQILAVNGGRECLELVLDTAIQTGTADTLNIWNATNPSMILGNAIQQRHHPIIEIILRRRNELNLGNFLEEMCFENIPVIGGWLFTRHIPQTTVELLVQHIGFTFYDACRLAFTQAILYFLANDPGLGQHPDRVLEGFARLLESPSWFSNSLLPGQSVPRCIMYLRDFYVVKSGARVPVIMVNRLLNHMWRVVMPYIRHDGGFGERTDITQDELLDAAIDSEWCKVYSRHFNLIVNMSAHYSSIPYLNPNNSVRLGNRRFVDLVRRENIVLPLVFDWTQSDRNIIWAP
ncbi:hypothetical protein K445DRAFT_27720 [Daldinia sp. EC12]|nr:hypothetical protein K445DRAFT_27720 [Daldinia sp. EC12]